MVHVEDAEGKVEKAMHFYCIFFLLQNTKKKNTKKHLIKIK